MLEYAIRPYTAPNAQGKILIPSTPTSNVEHPMLTWGAQSQLPPPVPGQISIACCNEKSKQVDKKGETVRIHGSDGVSYVDVFRANELTFNNTQTGDGGYGGVPPSGGTSGSCDNSSFMNFSSDVQTGVDAVLNSFNNAIAGAAGGQPQCQQVMTLDNNTHAAG